MKRKNFRIGVIQIAAVTIASVMLIVGAMFGARALNNVSKMVTQTVPVETMR